MRKIIKIALIALPLALGANVSLAGDSTSFTPPDIGWQPPNARSLGGVSSCPSGYVFNGAGSCVNTIANAANATTAQYANNAGQLGGNGMPTCPAGYALSGNGTNWSCVSNVNSSGYSTSSGNGVAGVSGNTLTTSNGTNYTLPSGGGGGSGTVTCQGFDPCSSLGGSCPIPTSPIGMTQSWPFGAYTCLGNGLWLNNGNPNSN